MPKTARDTAIVALAEAMLRELESLRRQGGDAYPPQLRKLAALADVAATNEQVQQAAGKKSFTAKAVVPEKTNRKPALDSPVYFKGDVPPKPPAARKPKKPDVPELAGRMLLVLQAQRRLGVEAYPPTLRRLAELCDLNASDNLVPRVAEHEIMNGQAVVAAKSGKKPNLDAPVSLKEDLDGDLGAVLPALLRFALAAVTGKGKTPKESTAFTLSEIKKKFITELQNPVQAALERGGARGDLPVEVAWVVSKGQPYLFLVENLRPRAAQPIGPAIASPPPGVDGIPVASARPASDFATAFREAFEHLDRRNGATNFVKLADLRRALGGFGREEFDAGLRTLRLGGEFALDSHEGLHGSLTPEERDAGVREAGSLLVYVSRR